MTLGIDRWIYPWEVTSSNDQIILFEDDGAGTTKTATVSVSNEVLWAIQVPVGPTGLPAPITGLYDKITDAITDEQIAGNLISTGSYAFNRIDPADTGNTFDKKSGIRFEYLNTDIASFELRFSNSNFTFPPEIFGFADDRSTDAVSSSLQIDGPHTCWGCWTSPRIGRKKRNPRYDQEMDEASYDRFTNVRWDSTTMRAFRYFNLAAVHVYRGRASRDKYASVGQLAKHDDNNAWEDVWDQMNDGRDAIIIHDSGDTAEDINADRDNFDVCRLAGESRRNEFRETLREEDRQAEFYTVEQSVRLDPDHSPYTY